MAEPADAYDLERFVVAQDGAYDGIQAELRAGAKSSHWMWFVFPQLAGLGHSATARHYALSGLEDIAITFTLRKWRPEIPSLWHAIRDRG